MGDFALTGLEGKVAVVTGAGRMRSIGRPIAVELARAGCDIVLTGTGRSPDRYPDDEKAAGWRDIASVAAEVEALGRRALPLVADIADIAAVESLADQVLERFGRVDIVVNNAGAARGEDRRPVIDLEVDAWNTVMNVNLTGTFFMSKVFGRKLVEAGNGGSIVNISSIAGMMGIFGGTAYGATKWAVRGMTKVAAKELGRHGIRVNSIHPGYIETDMLSEAGLDDQERLARTVPLRRMGTVTDIASMALFLAGDTAAYCTGQEFVVDGGVFG